MKVLHLNTFDTLGGAARAAYRIHAALRESGVRSSMLVGRKDSDDPDVEIFPVSRQQRKLRWASKLLDLQNSTNPTWHSCNLFPSGLHQAVNVSDADVVHLHWVGNELISIAEIGRIAKPLVWTLHDMWAFCGAEHYDHYLSPGRYLQGYGWGNRPPEHTRIDIDAWTWRRKRRCWRSLDCRFVTPSRWLAGCLRESRLFFGTEAAVIPYPLDINVFAPTDRKAARAAFGLPEEGNLVLFGADYGKGNPLKGYLHLEKALGILAVRERNIQLELVVFGEAGRGKGRDVLTGFPVNDVGRIDNDDRRLAMLYRAADAFILPSIMDNLPNTVLEAMSCGVPCVGFRTCGIPDMIEHRETGYLAEPFEAEDLANGIEWVLCNTERANLGRKARAKVEREYSNGLIGGKYRKLYERVLNPG